MEPRLRDLLGARAWLTVWLPIGLITVLHYAADGSERWPHDVFRRLYYVPIILGAFGWGLTGALAASVVASLAYAPHAFTHFFHHDPADQLEKGLEIVLYNAVALVTGLLAGRERRERRRQEEAAAGLAAALEEKRAMEEHLQRAERFRALGEMVAGMAHEIRNPLASVQGAAEAIADEVAPDSPRRHLVEIQRRELDRLQVVLDRYLSLARPGASQKERLDLRDPIREARDLFAAEASRRGLDLVADPGPEPLHVEGDRTQLVQVLVNLVLNALEATPSPGSVRIAARSVRIEGRAFWVVDVTDTGPGVPRDLWDRVCDPFFSTKEGGTGLGLSISSTITAAHDGFVEVGEGEGGRGARFSVFLPRARGPGGA